MASGSLTVDAWRLMFSDSKAPRFGQVSKACPGLGTLACQEPPIPQTLHRSATGRMRSRRRGSSRGRRSHEAVFEAEAAGQACSISKISMSHGAEAASAQPVLMTLHHQHAA